MKKGILIGALAGGLALGAGTAQAGDVLLVASGEDLAAAIEAANSDSSIETIRCSSEAACDYVGTLPAYTGTHRLVVDGHYSTIDATGVSNEDIFTSVGGAPLKLMRLTFIGGKSGLYVEIPAEKTGSQRVELKRMVMRDAAWHAVYINDVDYSVASVRLTIDTSRFLDNGFAEKNKEGIRVRETSKGMIMANITNSTFRGNSGDGLSLNEKGGGRVFVTMDNTDFIENGSNPLSLYDLEDGFDVDEFGPGDVWLTVTNSRFNKNFDDGVDIDERQGGSIYATFDGVFATKNLDQGMTFDERLKGDFVVDVSHSTISGNDGAKSIDLYGSQSDIGDGSLTLNDVTINNWSLSGVLLTVTP